MGMPDRPQHVPPGDVPERAMRMPAAPPRPALPQLGDHPEASSAISQAIQGNLPSPGSHPELSETHHQAPQLAPAPGEIPLKLGDETQLQPTNTQDADPLMHPDPEKTVLQAATGTPPPYSTEPGRIQNDSSTRLPRHTPQQDINSRETDESQPQAISKAQRIPVKFSNEPFSDQREESPGTRDKKNEGEREPQSRESDETRKEHQDEGIGGTVDTGSPAATELSIPPSEPAVSVDRAGEAQDIAAADSSSVRAQTPADASLTIPHADAALPGAGENSESEKVQYTHPLHVVEYEDLPDDVDIPWLPSYATAITHVPPDLTAKEIITHIQKQFAQELQREIGSPIAKTLVPELEEACKKYGLVWRPVVFFSFSDVSV